jgi:protein TonB
MNGVFLSGAAASIIVHATLLALVDREPALRELVAPPPIEMIVVEPPPPPPPPPLPPPVVEPAKPAVHEAPRPRARPVAVARVPVAAPPPPVAVAEAPPSTSATTETPVFGVAMQSSSAPGGLAVPAGNTQDRGAPVASSPGPVKPLAVATAAAEVTRMPVPLGRCSGKYTEAARAAGLEGVVTLDLVVDAAGRAQDVTVISGLSHGLTEAAVAALTSCRFMPGERDGQAVPVRIRGFKIRFLLDAG